MPRNKDLLAVWSADETGYEVLILRPSTGDVVAEYHGGNHALDSVAYAPPGSRFALDESVLRKYAAGTCRDMAREHNVVYGGEDPDGSPSGV